MIPRNAADDAIAGARWLVTGAHGMLGRDLVAILATHGAKVTVTDRDEVDITDPAAALAAVTGHDIVVNTAAWTDVDAAEANEPAATRINGDGPANLAAACARTGARLVHVSTDYVFAGDASVPYPEDAPPAPVNAYGRSKLAGERAVLIRAPEHGYIARTEWLYGVHGNNFVSTMLRLARERDHVTVVNDQVGQPTWAHDLAERITELAAAALTGAAPAGIYHATASGSTSWFGLARAVFAEAGLDPDRVHPTTSDKFERAATRPAFSLLGHDRWETIGMRPMRDWRQALAAAMPSMVGVSRPKPIETVE